MPRFMLVYKGEATDVSDMTEDQQQDVLAAWGAWMERVGPALADVGTPLAPAASIVDDGTTGTPAPLNGYSIVEADDLDAARQFADGHPFLSENTGDFAIDVYEVLPVPEM